MRFGLNGSKYSKRLSAPWGSWRHLSKKMVAQTKKTDRQEPKPNTYTCSISKKKKHAAAGKALANSIQCIKQLFKHPDDGIFNHYKDQVTKAVHQILSRDFPDLMNTLPSDVGKAISVHKGNVIVLFGCKEKREFPIQVQVSVTESNALQCTFVKRENYVLQKPEDRNCTAQMSELLDQEEERRTTQANPPTSILQSIVRCCRPLPPNPSRTNSSVLHNFTMELKSEESKRQIFQNFGELSLSAPMMQHQCAMGVPVVEVPVLVGTRV